MPAIDRHFSPDTDVAVLCWYHFSQLSIQELWFHTGTGRNKRFISVLKCFKSGTRRVQSFTGHVML